MTVNTDKTVVMHQPSLNTIVKTVLAAYCVPLIRVNINELKTVDNFAYLGSTFLRCVKIGDEWARRLSKANQAFDRLQNSRGLTQPLSTTLATDRGAPDAPSTTNTYTINTPHFHRCGLGSKLSSLQSHIYLTHGPGRSPEIHRAVIGALVFRVPAYTYCIRLHFPHSTRKFARRMGPTGPERTRESRFLGTIDAPNTTSIPDNAPVSDVTKSPSASMTPDNNIASPADPTTRTHRAFTD
ncbi:hypothetical protein SprV_0702388600 [Sparganum proliferum]